MKNIVDLVGRILLSAYFLFESYDTLANWSSTKETLDAYGLIWRQDLLIGGAGTLLFLGGILLLIGYRVVFGSILLLAYWIPITCIVYSFWDDPISVRRMNMIFFMKNMALAGGLLSLMAHGSGKYSVKKLISVLGIKRRRF